MIVPQLFRRKERVSRRRASWLVRHFWYNCDYGFLFRGNIALLTEVLSIQMKSFVGSDSLWSSSQVFIEVIAASDINVKRTKTRKMDLRGAYI